MNIISQTTPVAKKAHVCDECDDGIKPGDIYSRAFIIDGGVNYVCKLCPLCAKASAWYCGEMDDPHEGYDVGSMWASIEEFLDGDELPEGIVRPKSREVKNDTT